MARRCKCAMLIEAAKNDPALCVQPLAVRMVFILLLDAMMTAGVSVLRFGSQPLSVLQIGLLVRVAQSELEANLATLLDYGLLVKEADGAIGSPLLAAAMTRSDINRANGLRGAAVRKRQAEERRQGEMKLPIVGGLERGADPNGESKPKANEPNADDPPASLAVASTSSAKLAASADTMRIGDALLDIAGINPAAHTGNFMIVGTWLKMGADEGLILGAARRVMARGGRSLPNSVAYFDKAVREDLERRRAAPVRNEAWNAAMDAWKEAGGRGPMPQLADYQTAAA